MTTTVLRASTALRPDTVTGTTRHPSAAPRPGADLRPGISTGTPVRPGAATGTQLRTAKALRPVTTLRQDAARQPGANAHAHAADADAADAHSWVDAAPFRAHLAHVVQHSGVPWPAVAIHAGVSVALARHLLHGRGGRRLVRLEHDCAERLLRVNVDSARSLRHTWLDASPTAARLAELARRGVRPDALPAEFGLSAPLLDAIAADQLPIVAADVALAVRAALAWSDRAGVRAFAA